MKQVEVHMGNHLRVVTQNGQRIESANTPEVATPVRTKQVRKKLALFIRALANSAYDALVCIAGAIRYVLFLLMYWLRIVLYPVLSFAAGIGLIASIILLATQHRPDIMWKLGGFSFACFVVLWFYDAILLYLSPQQMMLDGRSNN